MRRGGVRWEEGRSEERGGEEGRSEEGGGKSEGGRRGRGEEERNEEGGVRRAGVTRILPLLQGSLCHEGGGSAIASVTTWALLLGQSFCHLYMLSSDLFLVFSQINPSINTALEPKSVNWRNWLIKQCSDV